MNRFENNFSKDSAKVLAMIQEYNSDEVFTLFSKIKELCAEYYTNGYDDCSIIDEGEYTT
jgi:hypothetical protein